MARKFLTPVDLAKNELQNARVQNLASAPASPVTGQLYYDTANSRLYYYNGSAWVNRATDSDLLGGSNSAYHLDRTNHTGTQAAATISNFDSQVRASRLDQMAAPTAPVAMNDQRLTGLGTPTADTDASTKVYVDSKVQGLDAKDSVRAATTANIALSGTQTIDGVAVVAGDRVLVKNQTTGADNGIYVVASAAWARAPDADTSAEVNSGLFVFVEEGTTNADSGWTLTTNNPITLGSTPLSFTQFSGAGQITAGAGLVKTGNTIDVGAGTGITVNVDNVALDVPVAVANGGTGATTAAAARTNLGATTKFSTTVGDGGATSINVDHNLGTLDVTVETYQNSDGAKVDCDVTHSTTNRIILGFAIAPAANAIRVVIVG